MAVSTRLAKPLSMLIPPRNDLPFAIQYTLDNDLGPNDYEEFWFDSKFFVIKAQDFATNDEFINHRYQKGIIYGPMDQEITYPAGTIVIGVSTTEQFRPGEDNDGSPLSNQDSDADGVPDDLDPAPSDYQVPYPDADMDGVHVIPDDPNTDPDDENPDDPFPDADQDGYHSNVDPDDNDPNIIPEQQPATELKIQAEYVILYPEPSIFEGFLDSTANQGQNAVVYQAISLVEEQHLYITPGAYFGAGATSTSQLEMRGKMRFSVGGSVSNYVAWDADETALKATLEAMSIFDGRTIIVNGTIPKIIAGNIDDITIIVTPPQGDRIMLWGISLAESPALTMQPNTQNGGIPSYPYRYAFKCRSKFGTKVLTYVAFNCYNGSQYGTIDAHTYVMCRKINGTWHIIYP